MSTRTWSLIAAACFTVAAVIYIAKGEPVPLWDAVIVHVSAVLSLLRIAQMSREDEL